MRPYKRGKEYEALKESLADRLIESVERHYLPGLNKHIVLKEVGTPATVASYVRAPMGGIYGLEHTPDQTFLRRFLPTTGVPGLFLAGSAVLGAGVMPCTMSGAIAASLVHQALTAKRAFLALPKLDLAPSSTA